MRYWLHDECGHAKAYSNSYHNGEKSNPHLTASLLELGGARTCRAFAFRCEGPAPQAAGISGSGCSWDALRAPLGGPRAMAVSDTRSITSSCYRVYFTEFRRKSRLTMGVLPGLACASI